MAAVCSPWRAAGRASPAVISGRNPSVQSVQSLQSSGFWGTPARGHAASSGSQEEPKVSFMVVARKRLGFTELFNRSSTPTPKRALLKPGNVSPRLPVPPGILKPPYADTGIIPKWDDKFQIQNEEGIKRMREAGKLAAEVRDFAGSLVKPGVITDEIDKAVHEMIINAGAYPSPLNYGRFPKSVCTSVNECICHGIPDSRALEDGDIINIDVTVYLNGYHGDTSKTFFCGTVSPEARQLVEVTKTALDKAISMCGPGVEFRVIGNTIHDIADKYKYGVVRQFVGHGVGQAFHSGPTVVHYKPMLTIGSPKDYMWDDDWTVVTADGSLSAQFEHTILITETGVEILTL